MQNTIKIPSFLHDFHGEKSNWLDIAAIHLIAALTTVLTILLATDLDWPVWKYILIGIVSYDIGGGVIANFTYSTNHYYDQSNKKRLIFLSLHFFQPALLSILFFDQIVLVLSFCSYILAISFIINAIKDPQTQLTLSVLLLQIGLLVLFMVPFGLPLPLMLLLTLFMLKLPFSFSVKWYQLKKS